VFKTIFTHLFFLKLKEPRKEKSMRTKMKEIGSETRERYRATVGRMGIKSNAFKGFPERTILLKDVVNVATNEIVTDHLWFTVGKTLKKT
jgi:hypothetical protein